MPSTTYRRLAPGHLECSTTGPDDGFGRLWRQEFRVDLGAMDPRVVVADWKAHFDEYWPAVGTYQRDRVREGDVAPVEMGAPGAGPALRTAVVVVHEDAGSFVFATARGHMFAGVIAFSAHADRGRTTLRNLAEAFDVEPGQVPQSTTLLDRRRIWSHWGNIRHNAALHSAVHWATAPRRNRRQVLEP